MTSKEEFEQGLEALRRFADHGTVAEWREFFRRVGEIAVQHKAEAPGDGE